MPGDSKTEKATPKKRRDERKKGNVFLSKDAVSVASLLAVFAVFRLVAGSLVDDVNQYLHYCMALAAGNGGVVEESLGELTGHGIMLFVKMAGPMLAASVVSAVAATFAQTRLLVSADLMKPKFSRINPLEGFKRLFSLKSIIEALKGILKITLLLVIIYQYLIGIFGELSRYLYADLASACQHLFEGAFTMVMQISVAFIVLAGFDFLYQWWDYERQLKMSKQEVKEEYKQMEGDPQVKGKIKEIQRKMAQSRMMQQVPGADVVVRNPTHFAVALRYKPEQDNAPIVLAKGQDELALRIVKVAEENGVPVMENVPLARALYAGAELDREIPAELYGAVAEVLVYLYRLDAESKYLK